MATQLNNKKEYPLDSGKKITIKPLKIKALRVFMEKIDEMASIEDENEVLGILVDAGEIAIKACNPELDEDFDVEEEIDLPTLYSILELAGGVDLTGGKGVTGQA